MNVNLKINDMDRVFEIEPGEMLLDALRKCGYASVKKACDTGSCGACTVLVDGRPISSCSYLAARAEGHTVTTIEGVKEDAERIGKLLNEEGAVQCGFCTPGFLITVIAMKKELKNPNIEDIKNYLVGNLCRCSGYEGQLRAVIKYLGVSE